MELISAFLTCTVYSGVHKSGAIFEKKFTFESLLFKYFFVKYPNFEILVRDIPNICFNMLPGILYRPFLKGPIPSV